jgi:hypothetical protein
MPLFVHSARTKGGKKHRKEHRTKEVVFASHPTMGNTESLCFNNGEEIRKPAAFLDVDVDEQCSKCTDARKTWHGNHHEASSTSTTASNHNAPPSPRQTRHGLWILHSHPPPNETHSEHLHLRRNSAKGLHKKLTHAVTHFFQCLEEFMFPKMPLIHQQHHKPAPHVRGGVLLKGCETPEEHYERIKTILEAIKELHGSEGLKVIGLEYRVVPCDEHKATCQISMSENCDTPVFLRNDHEGENHDDVVEGEAAFAALAKLNSGTPEAPLEPDLLLTEITESLRSIDGSYNSVEAHSNNAEIGTTPSLAPVEIDDFCCVGASTTNTLDFFCHLCSRRLFHIESNTMVDEDNRKAFIADGDMYEAVSRLVQEHAHDVMMEEGGMKWITVDRGSDKDTGAIRVLINSDHPILTEACNGNDRPTVLICTGRGKVRAGIFSRQHLICSGLETATAVPLVRDAVTRHLNVVIVDPNVRGESQGFVTFQKTMDFLEGHFSVSPEKNTEEELSCRDMYVVSHSASGGHVARYFLDKCDSVFLRNIRAVAFTDSTHSIQWAKGDDKKYLHDLLQSEHCVYFRCAREGDGIAGDGLKWYLHPAGEPVHTDLFWRHRFGTIQTFWAGTNEHSMTNWFSHAKIWEHFDRFLFGRKFNRNTDDVTGAVSITKDPMPLLQGRPQ